MLIFSGVNKNKLFEMHLKIFAVCFNNNNKEIKTFCVLAINLMLLFLIHSQICECFFFPILYKSVEFCVTTPPVGQSYYVQKQFCIFVFITRVDNIKKRSTYLNTHCISRLNKDGILGVSVTAWIF